MPVAADVEVGLLRLAGSPQEPTGACDEALTEQTRGAHYSNRKVYGAPRVHAELTDAGVHVGRKRVARLMRDADLVGCHRRKRSFSKTRQDPKADVAPDRVDRTFVATRPNRL